MKRKHLQYEAISLHSRMSMCPRSFSRDTEAQKSYLPSVSCCNLASESLHLFTWWWGWEETWQGWKCMKKSNYLYSNISKLLGHLFVKRKKKANWFLIFISLMLHIREKAWKALGGLMYFGPIFVVMYRTPRFGISDTARKFALEILVTSHRKFKLWKLQSTEDSQCTFCSWCCVYFPLVSLLCIIRTKAWFSPEEHCCVQKY